MTWSFNLTERAYDQQKIVFKDLFRGFQQQNSGKSIHFFKVYIAISYESVCVETFLYITYMFYSSGDINFHSNYPINTDGEKRCRSIYSNVILLIVRMFINMYIYYICVQISIPFLYFCNSIYNLSIDRKLIMFVTHHNSKTMYKHFTSCQPVLDNLWLLLSSDSNTVNVKTFANSIFKYISTRK